MAHRITAEDFLSWAKDNPEAFKKLYKEELSELIYDLEADDYFGTEGFNKRFA